ncbi:flagellar hook-length control protein FliK [Vibrio sp. Hep-1b-8]|uniref:flagellar hook-length control protein FliK n=1 Tax=Vibrio sp. Hep-1b-8 TaxID=2144187 RepID=UPI001110A13C|nr:flagellar hook-length control protein FliK [Vibrio sp. Hep-1b-8]TMX30856.1 flagellar hook-length control protein FliK [Vibrio sp. Hep-1b-8]
MNINLSSVSESPKVTKTTTDGGDASVESSESGGFFAKLAALIKGETSTKESAGKVEGAEASAEQTSVSKGESGVSDVKAQATESQSVDELLVSDESEAEDADTARVTKDVAQSAKPEISQQDENSHSAAKIVSENDEVLQRLDTANKALQPADGKELPQDQIDTQHRVSQKISAAEEQQNVSSDATKVTATDSQSRQEMAPSGEPTSKVSDSDSLKQQVVMKADGEDVIVPASAQKFIQQDSQVVADEESGSQVAQQAAVLSASVAKVNKDNTLPQETAELSAVALDETALSAEVMMKQSPADGSEEENDASANDVGLAAGAIAASTVAATKVTDKPSKSLATALDSAQPSNQVMMSASDVASEAPADVTIAAAAVTAGAIPWASTNEPALTDEVSIKPETPPKAQQAAVAQSVHQALTTQQAQAQMAQTAAQMSQQQSAVSAMPTDLMASQMQQVAATPHAALTQDQAVLKAALGAKAAGSLGKLVGGKDGGQPASESSSAFAQQLAQVSGQQGPNSLGQIRAEQAAAQVPLQLTREIAGEQVAERVQMMMSKNLKNIDIRLDPPELGRMQIRMNMNGDVATVHFTVANQQARDVIEQSMPRLREMLAQQGVQLGDSSVQQQASGQQQRRYADNGQGNSGQGSSGQGLFGEENLEPDINLDLNVAAKRDGISYYA